MITIFRRIREKLIASGSITKYLLYAVGEILLVVIGILIALQVNNWNLDRLERAEEEQILQNLKTEFEDSITQLTYLNELRSEFLLAAEDIVEISNSGREPNSQVMDSLISVTMYAPTFNDPTGSIQSLINSNRINLISNNQLKVELMSWPSESRDMTEEEERAVILFDQYYRPFIFQYVSFADIAKIFQISDINFSRTNRSIEGVLDSGLVTSDYASLISDKKFINILHSRAITNNVTRYESGLLITKAEHIIELIDTQLTD